MPTLQVRDVPEHIYRRLVREAERDRRSLAQQAVAILAKGLDVEIDLKTRRKEALRKAAAIDRSQTSHLPSSVNLIREDRDR
jgi:antitoxin FitA-like protein